MKTPLIRFILILIGLYLSACAGRGPIVEPSEQLFITDKSTTQLLGDLKKALETVKYKVRRVDSGAGILITEPRRFTYNNNGGKSFARQKVLVRQEGASVKIRMSYDCNHSGDGRTYEPCYVRDESSSTKISRVEALLLKKLAPLLRKKRHATDEFDFESGEAEPVDAPAPETPTPKGTAPGIAEEKPQDLVDL